MTLEYVKKIFNIELESYGEKFEHRERLIDVSIAFKMMIYPDYMLVNKTNYDILYNSCKIISRTNDFL